MKLQERLEKLGIKPEDISLINNDIDNIISQKKEPLEKSLKSINEDFEILKNNHNNLNKKYQQEMVSQVTSKLTINDDLKKALITLTKLNDNDFESKETLEKKFQEQIKAYPTIFNKNSSNLGNGQAMLGENPFNEQPTNIHPDSKFDKKMPEPTDYL